MAQDNERPSERAMRIGMAKLDAANKLAKELDAIHPLLGQWAYKRIAEGLGEAEIRVRLGAIMQAAERQ